MDRRNLNSWVRERLRDLFASTGMTVPQFAKATKISQRQIHKIKDGGTESTSVENLVQWTLTCGVHPSEFFSQLKVDKSEIRLEEDQKLVELFTRALLVKRKRDAVAGLLTALFEGEPSRSTR